MKVNIFDFYNEQTQTLLQSLKTANLERSSLFVHYRGELPDGALNPFTYFTGISESNRLGRFFNQVTIPTFYEIRHADGLGASIEFLRQTVGRINYRRKGYRLVDSVDWYSKPDNKELIKKDLYNIAGDHYATTFYNAGQAYVTEYYRDGVAVIVENLQTQTIQLNYQNQLHFFDNLTQFFLYFLKAADITVTSSYINSLSYPLFISEAIAQKPNATLFWQEPMGENVPGNMANELKQPRALRQIVFDKQAYLEKVTGLYPDTTIELAYLSPIGVFKRQTAYRKNAFVLTNSDNMPGLETILSTFPELMVTVAAQTNMSEKLLNIGEKYTNLHLIPSISDAHLTKELEKADIYLDINAGNKVGDILKRAYQSQMLILSLAKVKQNNYRSLVFEDTKTICDAIASALNKQADWRKMLKQLIEQGGKQSTVADYQQALTKVEIEA
ncbi:hypothetical protein WOSG25_080130 [Weissella oryzae SG25]|uniref:UDP-N-acetylglucosamine--peptide N-acetylglucosaminyltransferase stabilizing protein GtfB n=1 Tax=Weissella oryzae (strain DSM 25784 / JCM 18191 / LMG 30913 / SG25) TaxID=1329250 RepID=A0A069D1E9_WEIOS|nr:hypothetical protein [Weissella oryzae]GAK31181.1 hypothetical protein WOSG25_080130 [Weissella oryzae SG25]